jgi:hypothetical protein
MAKQTFTTGQVLTAAQMTSLQQTAMGGGSATAKTASYVLVAADAGGTVAMNAAGATTITVNTGLFAAGDTVFIQNLGAGRCVITAGTATVSTAGSLTLPQYDAGILYFTATGASIFYDYIQGGGSASPLTTKGDLYGFSTLDARIPIGTNNQVLTADSTQALGLKWATPASGSTYAGASVYKTSSQSIASGSYVVLNYGSENFDTDAFHDTSTNNSRLTVPSGKAGKYSIQVIVSFAASGVGDRRIGFFKNGSGLIYPNVILPISTDITILNGTTIVDLSVGDYMEVVAYQNTGGNLNINSGTAESQFSISYLGA